MKNLYFYLMIFLWLFPTGIRAQQPFFKELNIDPQNDNVKATAIYQDKDEIIYVGTGVGKITLYKGKTVVQKNIDEKDAVDALINLIREHGDWVERRA